MNEKSRLDRAKDLFDSYCTHNGTMGAANEVILDMIIDLVYYLEYLNRK